MFTLRQATPADAGGISEVLQELTAAGQRTLPDSVDFVGDKYIGSPTKVSCLVALSETGAPLAIQILSRAEAGNAYGVEPGWGMIGTHVSPKAQGMGIGQALFAQTLHLAKEAGLLFLDASIGAENTSGRAYYERMGFESYRQMPGRDCKRFDVSTVE